MFIITSERDSIIPRKMTIFFDAPKDANKKKLREINGVTHDLVQDSHREEFRSATVQWFKQTL